MVGSEAVQFNKYLLNFYHIFKSVLGVEDIKMKNINSLEIFHIKAVILK